MASVKQELREFYRNQGTTGKALRSAIRYDLRSIRKQGWRNGRGSEGITAALAWSKSVEGNGYWLSRSVGRPAAFGNDVTYPLRVLR